jgi:hypothetical protein
MAESAVVLSCCMALYCFMSVYILLHGALLFCCNKKGPSSVGILVGLKNILGFSFLLY